MIRNNASDVKKIIFEISGGQEAIRELVEIVEEMKGARGGSKTRITLMFSKSVTWVLLLRPL